MKLKTTNIIFTLLILVSTGLSILIPAGASEALTPKQYGEIYIVEQVERPFPEWRVGGFLGGDLANPYYRIWSASVQVDYRFSPYWRVGILGNIFRRKENNLFTVVKNELTRAGGTLESEYPAQSFYLTTQLIPLMGHFSLFSSAVIQAELTTTFGGGASVFSKRLRNESPAVTPSLMWSVGPNLVLNDHWATEFTVGTEADWSEASFSDVRWQGRLGLSYRF